MNFNDDNDYGIEGSCEDEFEKVMGEQYAKYERDRQFDEWYDTLTEEGRKDFDIAQLIPIAQKCALDYIFSVTKPPKFTVIESDNPRTIKNSLQLDSRYKIYIDGFLSGSFQGLWENTDDSTNDGEISDPKKYSYDELLLFAEQFASEKYLSFTKRKDIEWLAAYEGFLSGIGYTCSSEFFNMIPSNPNSNSDLPF